MDFLVAASFEQTVASVYQHHAPVLVRLCRMRGCAAGRQVFTLGLVSLHELCVALGMLAQAGWPARRELCEVVACVLAGGGGDGVARARFSRRYVFLGAAGASQVRGDGVVELGGGSGHECTEGKSAHGGGGTYGNAVHARRVLYSGLARRAGKHLVLAGARVAAGWRERQARPRGSRGRALPSTPSPTPPACACTPASDSACPSRADDDGSTSFSANSRPRSSTRNSPTYSISRNEFSRREPRPRSATRDLPTQSSAHEPQTERLLHYKTSYTKTINITQQSTTHDTRRRGRGCGSLTPHPRHRHPFACSSANPGLGPWSFPG